jgi:hypothetical protein
LRIAKLGGLSDSDRPNLHTDHATSAGTYAAHLEQQHAVSAIANFFDTL